MKDCDGGEGNWRARLVEPLVRRPGVLLGAGWLTAVLLGTCLRGTPGLLVLVGLLAAWGIGRRLGTPREAVRRIPALVLLGFALAFMLACLRSGHERILPPEGKRCVVLGTVVSDVQEHPMRKRPVRLCVFRLATTRGPWQIRIWLPPSEPTPEVGDRWVLSGRVRTRGYGGRVLAVPELQASAAKSRCVRARASHAWLRACLRARSVAADYLAAGMAALPHERGVMNALMLGYRSDLARDERDCFARVGVLHIFAISGLHIAIIASLLVGVLRGLGVSRLSWPWVIVPLLFFYTLATGAQPSAMRATVMASCYVAAPALLRRPCTWSAFAMSLVLLLAWDPAQICNLGLILSYVIVAGIVLLQKLMRDRLRWLIPWHRRYEPDPFLPPAPPVRPWSYHVGMYLEGLVVISTCAWLASLGLTAWYFNRISFVALLANLVVVPLSFVLVAGGTISLLVATFIGFGHGWINQANGWVIRIMCESTALFDRLPLSSMEVERPSGWWMAAWYGVLVLWSAYVHARGEDPAPAPERPAADAPLDW